MKLLFSQDNMGHRTIVSIRIDDQWFVRARCQFRSLLTLTH